MKRALYLVALIAINLFPQSSQITLTEIMFNPQTGNNEFIELFNLSATDTIDLADYKIAYSTANPDLITSAGFGTKLLPNSYAIVLEGDYDLSAGIYRDLIPPEALILKISDNSFGNTGMANSSDRPVVLINNFDDTLSVYFYSADNLKGFSDEKILLNNDNSSDNWGNAKLLNGTPGFKNSVSPLNFDLELSSIKVTPSTLFEGDSALVLITVRNRAVDNATNFLINLYNDQNTDSIASQSELLNSDNIALLNPGDSISTSFTIKSLKTGNYNLIGKVIFNADEDSSNNIKFYNFTVFPTPSNFNDVVVNEIMYAPLPGEPEWIEIFNNSDKIINIKNWSVSDKSTLVRILKDDFFLQPKDFLILSKDSTILNFYSIPSAIIKLNLPSLNNSGDAIILKDSFGNTVDSLEYLPSWGGSKGGKSLERILAEGSSTAQNNWSSSISPNKASPGRINSVTPKNLDLAVSSFKPEKNFAVLNSVVHFKLVVINSGKNLSKNFVAEFYRDENLDSVAQQSELLDSFTGSSLPANSSIEHTFQTQNFIKGNNVFIAIVKMEGDDDTTNNFSFAGILGVELNELRNDLVINEFMYAPAASEPEWIEIYNRSSKTINVKNYSVADNSDTVKVIDSSHTVNPGDYFVISSDSSIINFFNIPSKIFIAQIPSLNNSGDNILLLDSLNRVIDSLKYLSGWGGKNGYSLERIDPFLQSIDSLNWGTSKSKQKATPGKINSLTKKDFDLFAKDLFFTPQKPFKGQDVNLSVKIINIGKNDAVFNLELFEDTNLDSIPDLKIEQQNSLFLSANDSNVFPFTFIIKNLVSAQAYSVKINFSTDQDTTNNIVYKKISPGLLPQMILINEIMFNPAGGEPEWVEFFNNSTDTINLKNWSLSDVLSSSVKIKIKSDQLIYPKSYFVISRDSSILNFHKVIPSKIILINLPTLNNDVDGIVLKDDRELVIDSVLYNKDWGGTAGFSLERKSIDSPSNLAANWSSSKDNEQSTPGRINSVTEKQFDLQAIKIGTSPRFPTPGDNVNLVAVISNNGLNTALNFSVQYFVDSDSNGTIDFLFDTQSGSAINSGDTISIVSAKTINNIKAKILVAFNVVNSSDEDTLNNFVSTEIQTGFPQNSIIVNEIMYNPENGEPEWIEIKNISDGEVNLINWSISDVLPKPTKNFITNVDEILKPGEYSVITKDTSFLSFHPGFNGSINYVNFGSLANTEDGVVIYDFRNAIIDSVFYKSSWGGKNGLSLERILPSAQSNDSLNWGTSLNLNGSTPGAENSLVNLKSFKKGSLVINEIMYEPSPDNSEFIEFYNQGTDSINIGGWKIIDENANSIKLIEHSFVIAPGDYFILAADSQLIKNYNIDNAGNINIINSSGLGLSNSGELIILKDAKNNVIDSVYYLPAWHNKNFISTNNISLEKINPVLDSNDKTNWSSSTSSEGATPLKQNSIFTLNTERKAGINVFPNPFSPDNDGFEDFTQINFSLSNSTSEISIKIFDSKGRLVRHLASNKPAGSEGSIIFDGLDDTGNPLKIGIYIIYLEAINTNNGQSESLKTVVVIARKL